MSEKPHPIHGYRNSRHETSVESTKEVLSKVAKVPVVKSPEFSTDTDVDVELPPVVPVVKKPAKAKKK